MTRLLRSKSCGLVGLTEFNSAPPTPFFNHGNKNDDDDDDDEEEDDDDEDSESEDESGGYRISRNPISTPFISPGTRLGTRLGGGKSEGQRGNSAPRHQNGNQFQIVDILVAALRKSLVTCSVEREDVVSSMDISWPTEVKHLSHVTFDRFNGFLGLPTELEPEVPSRAPSASVSVFGVSAKSMQCSYDNRGNSVPTILLMMQMHLYSGGGLKAEGIFRINAENSQEEYVRKQLNKGVVPHGIDVHCLAGLIKAWLRELPTGVLDSLTPEQVMHCNTEDDCTQLVKLLSPTEAALLDWAINLMADVVQHEQYNKMNARNIAMVFAPNMTQMADPLTALIHAVQVMNFLKTLILKTIREREESATKSWLISSCSDSPSNKNDSRSSNISKRTSFDLTDDSSAPEGHAIGKFMRATNLGRLESDTENFWRFEKKSDGEEESESVSGSSTPAMCETRALANGYDIGDWLSLRKGVRRLCRHPTCQLEKPTKNTRNLGIVNTTERDEKHGNDMLYT